jgi:3-oxoadipate enol-lactonase
MPVLSIEGVRHYYRCEGNPSKPTIMLAHPVGFDLGVWDKLVPLLTYSHHVLRYDLRGHGASEATAGDYSIELLVSDALQIMRLLGLGPVHFYGVSLGGLLGLSIAVHKPDVLATLTVSNLSAKLPVSREEWDRRISIVRREGVASLATGVRERMFSAAMRDADAPLFHTLMNNFLANDPVGYSGGLAALRDADLMPVLERITTPTLVIHGRDDGAVSSDHPAMIAQRIPVAKFAVVNGGHLSPVESPAEVADLLRQHLQIYASRDASSS